MTDLPNNPPQNKTPSNSHCFDFFKRTANKYITELFADEEVQDLGLEEVVFDATANTWKITIGFSRPWERRSLAANLGGQDWKNRSFKVVEINDHTSEIVGMTHRSLTTSN